MMSITGRGPERSRRRDVIALTVKSGATAEAAEEIAEQGARARWSSASRTGSAMSTCFEQARRPLRGRARDGRLQRRLSGRGPVPQRRRRRPLRRAARATLAALAEAVGAGPAALKLSDDMLGLAWGKLLINLNNAVNALSGRTLIEELKQRDYRRVFAASDTRGAGPAPPREDRAGKGRRRRARACCRW